MESWERVNKYKLGVNLQALRVHHLPKGGHGWVSSSKMRTLTSSYGLHPKTKSLDHINLS